ncbi:MAG: glycoside hydrolase family 97 catalytic domain-containing protein [Prevotella sp.]|nr:glycoside hydrolase family 97 catalytic domain-containing protein [Prevotella sp.]
MRKLLVATTVLLAFVSTMRAADVIVESPDGRLTVAVDVSEGRPTYSVSYDGLTMLEPSALGLVTDRADFTRGMTITGHEAGKIDTVYTMRGTKTSRVHYRANELSVSMATADKHNITVCFRVSNNDVAFRYLIHKKGDESALKVFQEATSFRLPEKTTTFITPQSDPMIGWKRTKPSYEEVYSADGQMAVRSQYGRGYTFPALFHVGDDGWVLVSETGTDGRYAGCRLLDYNPETGYAIGLPMEGENNGFGSSTIGMALPALTPWRTITVGRTLTPIVETTVAYDVVEERYAASETYRPGRYTWSWLIWQDNSINYDDQVRFIDLAAEMGYEYCLVDGCWDTNIGRERMAELSRYAQSKGVSLLLWYNSNGYWNDALQTPKQKMNTVGERRREMAWMKSIGVKGIKVDFFGGDKQMTMQLYEDILTDANDFGLQVIFHGCTLPRGWERMFPNFVASEAVLASENVYFTEEAARREAFDLTLHPFCRNTVASMDWGGTIMNTRMSRDNKRRHQRYTTNVFEMAAAVVIQTSVQCIAMQPNNLKELTADELAFLRSVPTEWDETRLIDGYPGRYVVLARRSGDRWLIAGLNATDKPLTLTLDVPCDAGQQLTRYADTKEKDGSIRTEVAKVKADKKKRVKVTIQPSGGVILDTER